MLIKTPELTLETTIEELHNMFPGYLPSEALVLLIDRIYNPRRCLETIYKTKVEQTQD